MDTELLKILVERTSYINTYWNFYIAVATGLVGIIATGKISITTPLRTILITAFVLFAISNLRAIRSINEQRNALIQLIPDSFSIVTKTLKPNATWQYILFHILLDVVVIFAVWCIKPNT